MGLLWGASEFLNAPRHTQQNSLGDLPACHTVLNLQVQGLEVQQVVVIELDTQTVTAWVTRRKDKVGRQV